MVLLEYVNWHQHSCRNTIAGQNGRTIDLCSDIAVNAVNTEKQALVHVAAGFLIPCPTGGKFGAAVWR